jgi:hypothetical protein
MSIAGFFGAAPVNLIFPVIVPPAADPVDDGGAAGSPLAAGAGVADGGAACTLL